MFLVIFIPLNMRDTIFILLTIRWMIGNVCRLPFRLPTTLWSRGSGRASSIRRRRAGFHALLRAEYNSRFFLHRGRGGTTVMHARARRREREREKCFLV
jgi:hypothetical protein